MRTQICSLWLTGLLSVSAFHARADDAAQAIVERSIQASGGKAALQKINASTSKMKGTVHTQGMALEYSGEIAIQGGNQQRIQIEFEVGGQKIKLTQVLNKDKGWIKVNDTVMEMDADKLAEIQENVYAQFLTRLLPLLAKDVTLALTGETKVNEQIAVGVKVSKQGRRDVTLFFDKKTHLLIKSESRVKDDDSGQEVLQESFFSAYTDKDVKTPLKLVIKRDNKPFLDAEISDVQVPEKLDEQTFDKP